MARLLRERSTHISLRPVPDENGSIDLLTRAFRSAGWAVFARAVDHHHFLDVGERDFDSYWDARPGALRSTVDRKMAKFPVDLEINDRFSPDLGKVSEADYENIWQLEEFSFSFLRTISAQEGEAGHQPR